ncbi:helix-turn-helix domain-containing protein [Kiritimatiellota bacterium B12222]|nr:helix-turn-helix domain-containing protein [Kiritimatiellota bacterium B12222]
MSSSNKSGWLKGGKGIAAYADVSFRTAQNWIASGRLPVRRLSARLIMVRPEDLDRFIEAEADRFEEASA